VGDVDGVEPDEGGEEADVGFGQLATDEVLFALEDVLEAVERGEEGIDSIQVSLVRRDENQSLRGWSAIER
jgi:hypothetical protein